MLRIRNGINYDLVVLILIDFASFFPIADGTRDREARELKRISCKISSITAGLNGFPSLSFAGMKSIHYSMLFNTPFSVTSYIS